MRAIPLSLLAAAVALASCSVPARRAAPAGMMPDVPSPQPDAAALGSREQTADQQVRQALSRLTFGARPGDEQRVRAMGVDRWIDEQLNPSRIDDRAMDAFLARFPTLRMSPSELVASYPPPQLLIARKRREQAANRRPAVAPDSTGGRLAALGFTREDSIRYRAAQLGARRVVGELDAAKVARAVASERQLQEVMVDFWENHFNIFAGKGAPERYMLASFDRDAIRPHALGKFRDLLGAVAHSPAMLYYLDNWESTVDSLHPALAGRQRRSGLAYRRRVGAAGRPAAAVAAVAVRRPKGLNENYGRELLELHTLGVNGGYTQQDVIEVARALTGWSIQDPRRGASFLFRPTLHDAGAKVVLGHVLPAGRGIEDGEEVLDILARSPSTARFISTKLVRRFVSDTPPPALVERAAQRYLATDGDIREVLRTIIESPEFFSRAAYRAKVKAPLEVVVSALRAVGAAPDSTPRTAQVIARMGEPVFGHLAPDGYPETGDAWINTGSILARINFGLALAAGRLPGASLARWTGDEHLAGASREAQVDAAVRDILGGEASPDTRRVLLSGVNPLAADSSATSATRPLELRGLAQIIGLALGAPEFQRR